MKKNYFKKTLSLALTVLMLMSCWVFVAPTEAEAAALVSATETYNKSMLSGINTNIDTTMPTVLGKFKDPNMEGDENASFHVSQYGSQHYKNIFYSPTVTSSEPAAKMTGISNIDSVMVYYPETVMLYDGTTKPQMGVVACVDGGNYAVRALSVYISANANGLVVTDHWKGSTTANLAHIINMHNGQYMMSNDGTEHSSYKHNTADHGEWYFYASDLRFDGALGATEFVRSIVPSWGFYGAYYRYYWLGNQTGDLTKITDAADKNIYVMNIKAYRDLLTTIANDKTTITNNAARYTPESVKAYVNAANAIINLNPKNVSQSGSAVATWGSNMTAAYNNYVTAKNGLKNREFEVTYENIFSLADWKYSTSSEKANVTVDLATGTVAVKNPNASGEYVTTHSGSSSNANTRTTSNYAMPVVGGQEYTIRYTTDGADTQMFAFFYDANGGCTHEATFGNYNFAVKNDIGSATFKAPDNSTQMEIRFDNNTPATTATFSNIMIYPTARVAEVDPNSWYSRPYRKLYTYNTAVGTLDTPARDGYDFDKWMADTDGDGVADAAAPTGNITASHVLYSTWTASSYTLTFNGNGGTPSTPSLNYTRADTIKFPSATRDNYSFESWKIETAVGNWGINETYAAGDETTGKYGNATLVAQWTKLWTVTFLDGAQGSQITTVQVKNGEAIGTLPNTTPTKASDATYSYEFDYWYGNGAKLDENTVITDDITVFPVFKSVPHTFEWADNPYKSATCDDPALVAKSCKGCGYSLGNVPYDGDNENWLAKGHEYTGEAIQIEGNEVQHAVKCVRYSTCGSTELADHSWDGNVSEGATCTTPGKIKKTCPCGAEKFVDGETDPTAHNFDYTTGTPNGDKTTHTVNCDYNNAHTETVNCSDGNADCKCDICGQELIHVYDEKTKDFEASKADCYNDAVYYYTCQCGKQGTETWTDVGSKLQHNWTNTETNLKSAADCENDEVYYKECSLCNVSSEGITDETWTKANTKWNHKFDGDYVDNKNGTHDRKCTNAGCTATGATANCEYDAWTKDNADTHSHTCTLCGYTPEAEEHDWTDWTTVDGATNETAAQHTRSCKVCYRVETESCEDSYKVTDRPETCTAPQLYTYTCEKCNHVYYVTGNDKTGHNYTGEVKSYNDGTHNFLCQNGCNTYGYEGQENAKTACTYEYTNNKDGEHQVTCTACKFTFAQECSGGQATCTAPAVCEKCKEDYGTTVPHSFKGDAVKLDGDFHAYLCEFCGDRTGISGVGAIEGGKQDCSGGKATCSALAVCDVCKDTHGELDADEHKWGDWINIEGTETHNRVCEYNNAHKEDGNCFSPDIEVVAPDCETAGYTLNTCEFCGHEWQTNPTDPLDHDWSAWTNNNDGTHTRTCKDETCKYGEDGGAKTETTKCTKENAEPVVTKPTCTEGGYTTYTCKDCGYVWTDDETTATGHSYTKQTKKTDSKYLRTTKDCVTDWTYWYCCDNCDVSAETEVDKYENIEALYWVREAAVGHKYDAKTATEDYLAAAATCTTKATYYYSCSVCGASSEDTDNEETFEYGAVLGHDWVEPAEDKLANYLATPSDCITDATYYYVCNREDCGISSKGVKTDGETWTDVDSKSGHDFDYEGGYTAGVAANCTDAGVVEHYTCQTCGKHFNADKTKEIAADKLVIAALKHDFEDVAKKDATCEEDGYTKHKQCQREDCGYRNNDYEVIPATGHEFKAENGYYCDAVYGYHAYKCTNCDVYGVDGIKYSVDASGLDPEIVGGIKCEFTGEYVNYEADGIHSHKLTCVCGNEQGDVCVDAEPEHVEPTCTEAGYYKHTCDVCSYEWIVSSEAEEDKVLGHKLIVKSNGNGTHSVTCERGCGYAEKAEKCSTETPAVNCGEYDICDDCKTAFGEAKPHVFTKYESDNNATCTEDGTKTAICDTCTGEEKAKDTVADKGSKLGHDMSEYGYSTEGWTNIPEGFSEIIAEPTCHAEGKSISFCSRCDYYKIKTVKADPTLHVWEKDEESEDGLKWTTVGGNCATGVTLVNKCTAEGCNATQSKTEAIPHAWKIVYIEEAGCTTHGYINFVCNVCSFTGRLEGGETVFDGVDYSDKNIVAAGAHDWEKLDGIKGDYAALDGKIVYVDDNGNVVHVEKYPEYNAVGRGKMYCQKCNHIEEVTLDAMGNQAYDEDGNLVHKHPEFATINADGTITYKSTLKTVAKVNPTCTVGGHEAYEECTRCSFSEYMIDHDKYYIEPTGHSDSNGDDKCDACKTTIREDASKNCGCICHKESGFMKFIYKIVNFFWKLFKIKPTCACGYKHY